MRPFHAYPTFGWTDANQHVHQERASPTLKNLADNENGTFRPDPQRNDLEAAHILFAIERRRKYQPMTIRNHRVDSKAFAVHLVEVSAE